MANTPPQDTTVEQVFQYETDIQTIETTHRNDLAIHLYSAFLLHQVNPQFPGHQWTSWPLPQPLALDPRMKADGEDFIVDDVEYSPSSSETPENSAIRAPDDAFGASTATLKSNNRKVHLQLKRRQISNPKATLVNEMHFLLQRKIRQHAGRKNNSKKSPSERILLADDSEIMKNISTRLATRLGKLLDQLSHQQRRPINIVPGPRSKKIAKLPLFQYQRTWQDVLLANVYNDKLNSSVDLDSHRKLYQKARKLFKDVLYPYENDPSFYEAERDSDESDSDESDASEDGQDGQDVQDVPAFNVADNLEAIESKGFVSDKLERPQDQMERRRKDQDFKERLFMGLMDQTVLDKQLSWAETDHVAGPYIPGGDLVQENREKILSEVSLKPKNFQTRVRRKHWR